MDEVMRKGPGALSKYASDLFSKYFPKAKCCYTKGRCKKGLFRLNGKLVYAKWASFTRAKDRKHKGGWTVQFGGTKYDLAVVFIERNLGEGIKCPKVFVFKHSDLEIDHSKTLSEQDRYYMYEMDQLQNIVFQNLKELGAQESHKIAAAIPVPKLAESAMLSERSTHEMTDTQKNTNHSKTIDVKPLDYFAFKQIASVKKKGTQALFHEMIELYVEMKCENVLPYID